MESIDISSDDDLPNIVIKGVQKRQSNASSNTVTYGLEDKENMKDLVDLTQGCDAELVLSGSSNKSLKVIDGNLLDGVGSGTHKRSDSCDSSKTIDLDLNLNDALFDELVEVNKVINHVECDEVTSLGSLGLDGASASATSSGYSTEKSRGKSRRNSGESVKTKPRKKATSTDRVTKKQKMAEEKATRQAANEVNKIYKPGECMKYMRVELHPTLAKTWFMSELVRELGTGASIVECDDMCHERVVLWSRVKAGRRITDVGGQMALSDTKEACDRAILILTAEEIAPIVAERRLARHVGSIKEMTGCEMTLAVFGVKDYFKSSSKKKRGQDKIMNEIEMEMAFTDLLVTSSIDVQTLDSPSELALFILHMTKAIAEQRHKLAKREIDEQAEFYMRGDSKKCVKVDKDGNGLSRLWQQMIAVLPHSSLEISRAVCSKYKSPLELYETCMTRNGVLELAETGIDRANLQSARARRLGPEFARKLHELFTATDGDTLVE